MVNTFIEIILHLEKHLNFLIQNFGVWTYLFLFLIIFAETGLIITPFLPGDSLLFAIGALAATGSLNVIWLIVLLSIAAIIGDGVNYAVGKYFGEKIIKKSNGRFLKKEYLDRTHNFYEKYGAKTIVFARFVPIVRTFAPFVAGFGTMSYLKFAIYNVTGGIIWVGLFISGGYFFGNIPIIKQNFTLVILGIIVVSILPGVIEFMRQKKINKANA